MSIGEGCYSMAGGGPVARQSPMLRPAEKVFLVEDVQQG
jgi:hypothetical protein